MAATKASASTEAVKQITYLAAALKAPRITEAAARLADQARDAGWTHEDYLAAVLEREVSARHASGARLRIRAAGFPSPKTLEDFDFDAQPAVRQQVSALASGGFLVEARNVVLLGPPGTGKTHLATALGVAAARHGHRIWSPACTHFQRASVQQQSSLANCCKRPALKCTGLVGLADGWQHEDSTTPRGALPAEPQTR
jgi:DNA replication protein DnaC